ncbi:MAG: GTPase ObgE [Deltaproteobacteria bacterium]|nr:GTPase ObgE [Deltaproteobacteria bacterium]MBW2362991.1 GTPase ObgE [Deltaproteobacteria bacterium]
MTSQQFVDEARITVTAGRGGDGCVSLHREKFVDRGGPDGGDGGRGGDVVLVADRNLATLLDQRLRREYHAEDGRNGEKRNRTGRNGESIAVRVPVGTLAIDCAEPATPLVDLTEDGQRIVVAKGGRGGRGNTQFKTSTRQTPDFAEPGREGGRRKLTLSLKLLADVGLVGLPNAGKSTLLRSISAARPRVANYPFTTLVPALGVVDMDERRFVVADVPGLIKGASEGAGLGDRFLRHIERTRVIIHLLDAGAILTEERDLVADWHTLRGELEAYEVSLAERPELVAINKMDVVHDASVLEALEKELATHGREVFRISAATGAGVPELMRAALRRLDAPAARGAIT